VFRLNTNNIKMFLITGQFFASTRNLRDSHLWKYILKFII